MQTDTWDVNDQLPQLATTTDSNGALAGDYHPGPLGEPQSEHAAAGTYYANTDYLVSVTDLTTSTGLDEYQNTYDAFGVETTTKLDASTPALPFGCADAHRASGRP